MTHGSINHTHTHSSLSQQYKVRHRTMDGVFPLIIICDDVLALDAFVFPQDMFPVISVSRLAQPVSLCGQRFPDRLDLVRHMLDLVRPS